MDATDRLGARIYLKTTAIIILSIQLSVVLVLPTYYPHCVFDITSCAAITKILPISIINAADRTLLTDLLAGSLSTNYSTPTDLLLVTGANKTLVLDTAVCDDLFIDSNSLNLSGTADPLLVNYQPTGTGLITKLYEFEEPILCISK
jgi:hypothetical protein